MHCYTLRTWPTDTSPKVNYNYEAKFGLAFIPAKFPLFLFKERYASLQVQLE